jgi:alkylhydroperoxidase family enzyme
LRLILTGLLTVGLVPYAAHSEAAPTAPRIAPLKPDEWNEAQKQILAPIAAAGPVYNIVGTLARHPDLYRAWSGFANHILRESTLPPRHRELLILRVGWLCRSEYEFAQHRRIGLEVGLSDAEIDRVTSGPEAPGWTGFERTLLLAADEMHQARSIGEPTWQALAAQYDTRQLLDLVFTAGQYNLVSTALNTLRVPLDGGLRGFPDASH